MCEYLLCAIYSVFEVLADCVFYWELIINRNNVIFQMTSNDVDFFSFQFISLKLARVTITGSVFVLHMQGAHFTGYRGQEQPTGGQKVNTLYTVPPLLISHLNHWTYVTPWIKNLHFSEGSISTLITQLCPLV